MNTPRLSPAMQNALSDLAERGPVPCGYEGIRLIKVATLRALETAGYAGITGVRQTYWSITDEGMAAYNRLTAEEECPEEI